MVLDLRYHVLLLGVKEGFGAVLPTEQVHAAELLPVFLLVSSFCCSPVHTAKLYKTQTHSLEV